MDFVLAAENFCIQHDRTNQSKMLTNPLEISRAKSYLSDLEMPPEIGYKVSVNILLA